jgi:hypothetical protein
MIQICLLQGERPFHSAGANGCHSCPLSGLDVTQGRVLPQRGTGAYTIETDLVCWLVREVFLRRKSQTVVVLMSATMDLQEFMEYFSRNGPAISIGSSAYAVQVYFLDDISSIIGDTDEVEMLSSH